MLRCATRCKDKELCRLAREWKKADNKLRRRLNPHFQPQTKKRKKQ